MNVGQRIKKRRKELHMTADELAEKLGRSRATIYRYESGDIGELPASLVQPLADALYMTPVEIFGWRDNKVDEEFVDIPIYGAVPAGVPIEAIENIEGHVSLPARKLSNGERYCALRVKGNSMYPKYMEDDIIIVKIQNDFHSGDDVVVYLEDDYNATLKTVEKFPDGITLVPYNREYKTKSYAFKGSIPIRVLGVVVAMQRYV